MPLEESALATGEGTGPPQATMCEPVALSRAVLRHPSGGELRRLCDNGVFLKRVLRKKLGLRKHTLRRVILGADEKCGGMMDL